MLRKINRFLGKGHQCNLLGQDAWKLVMRCILHACGQSCWKYSKPGYPPTCRHGCFHVVMFTEYDVKGRRAGKQLRNTITVMATDEGGMLGRLLTFQEHPYEGPTNYTCVVCMRSNVDLQDLRLVLFAYAPAEMPCSSSTNSTFSVAVSTGIRLYA